MPERTAGADVLAVLGVGVVAADTPVVRADDVGLTRGDGCFEGIRLRDGVVDNPELHFARLTRSAAALDIEVDAARWQALLAQAVEAWDAPGEAAVKLVLTRGSARTGRPTGYVLITALSADLLRSRRDGLRVVTLDRGVVADAFGAAPWLLGGVKTLSYAVNMAAAREAERRGADDVVFLGTAAGRPGTVLEAPTASVVWAIGSTLHTTPVERTGVLDGTTQRLLFRRAEQAGWQTARTLGTVEDLHAADVVWLVSSVRGPVDVIAIDDRPRTRRPEIDARIRALAGF